MTVYESSDAIGGLLRYGIPDFRLEKRALDRRLEQLRTEGVRFRPSKRVGTDPDVERLRRSVHALVLACGSAEPRDLQVPGRELGGIHFALGYLTQQNRRNAGQSIEPAARIEARDRDVVVIGGGETGSDCVGTAIRQGARSVTQVQYHARPPEHADVLHHWPRPVPERSTSDHDSEGGIRIWGWDTVGFEGRSGRVSFVAMQRLRWFPKADG